MTCFGPDGSHHQDGMTVADADWLAIDFMLWRSSIGTRVDRTFSTWEKAARGRGKAFCAYHFVYPTGRYPADAQAETFHTAVAGDKSIPCMLDWEHDGSLEPTFDDVLKVAAELGALGYLVPLIYTGAWYWSSHGKPTMSGHGLELVNSNYGNQIATGTYEARPRYADLGGDTGARWDVSYGGLSPVIWQYSSRVRWGDRYMDMNAHREPLDQLGRYFWTKPPLNPSEEPVTEAEIETVAQRTAELVWAKAITIPNSGDKWGSAAGLLGWAIYHADGAHGKTAQVLAKADAILAKVSALGSASGATAEQVAAATVAALRDELND